MTDPKKIQFDFSMFLLSLAGSAQVQLGLVADPISKQKNVNLQAAQQTIDILELLQNKTKGNLTENEEKLFEQVMFELRMQYLQIKNSRGE